jgi:hypothetical protein
LSIILKRTVSNNESITGREALELFKTLKKGKNTAEIIEKLQAFENYMLTICKIEL